MDANDIDKPQEKGQKKSAKHNSGAADLEKVTDFAEEREVLPQDITNVWAFESIFIVNSWLIMHPLILYYFCRLSTSSTTAGVKRLLRN